MPPPARPGGPTPRPDFSEVDWDRLKAEYPDGAHGLKRAMFIAFVGERAKQANDFIAWGLRPNPIHPQSRLARDNAAVRLEDEPNLVSSTALYPTMNASEHLVAAAQVIAFALQKGQIRIGGSGAMPDRDGVVGQDHLADQGDRHRGAAPSLLRVHQG
jgi:hypothetical protein